MATNQQMNWYMSSVIVALALLATNCTEAFVPSAQRRLATNSPESGHGKPNVMDVAVRKMETQLDMFMGSDGGILGIGTPEVVSRKNVQLLTREYTANSFLLTFDCPWNPNNTMAKYT